MTITFKSRTEAARAEVDRTLELWLPKDQSKHVATRLLDAMRYSVFNGGKRIRPIFCYAAAELIGGSEYNEATHCAAAAVECIHAYSLIHDDLPAMDDDDLRRGKPTCHIAFDEATAVLAGDALQALAFEKLSNVENPELACLLTGELARASGAFGMVGGQMLDLLAEGQVEALQLSHLELIHKHKTGALIRSALRMGAQSAGASAKELDSLSTYAEAIGLAFQVQDDILDIRSDTQTLGKPQGADLAMNKSTYVSLLGLELAEKKAASLVIDAKQALLAFGNKADFLISLADYIIDRRS